MSDLERVRKELTRLTERLREINSRKEARSITPCADADPPSLPARVERRPERGVS